VSSLSASELAGSAVKTGSGQRAGVAISVQDVSVTYRTNLQKNPTLTEAQAESIIEGSAVPLGAGCRQVILVPLSPPPRESGRRTRCSNWTAHR